MGGMELVVVWVPVLMAKRWAQGPPRPTRVKRRGLGGAERWLILAALGKVCGWLCFPGLGLRLVVILAWPGPCTTLARIS